MITVLIFIALLGMAGVFILFGWLAQDHPLYANILATFIAASIFMYCSMVAGSAGIYEISSVSNTTENVTINTGIQKYTVNDGFVQMRVVSPSLKDLLGFLAVCCYGFMILQIYDAYDKWQNSKSAEEGQP